MSRYEIPTTHTTIQQNNEMPLYDTFKSYFGIVLDDNMHTIEHINKAKNDLNNFLKKCQKDYIQTLQNDITQENLKTLKASKEYLTLLHIQYCNENQQVFGKGFKEALKEKSRCKLWYEIRYNSGSTKDKDIAIRRFKQSNLFGLYENNDINNILFQSLCDSTYTTQNLNQYKVSLNEALTFFTFLNIAKRPQSRIGTYYDSILTLETAIKKNFPNNDFPQSQSLDSLTQAFLNITPNMSELIKDRDITIDFDKPNKSLTDFPNPITQLMYCCLKGDRESVKKLLDSGVDVDVLKRNDNASALHFCINEFIPNYCEVTQEHIEIAKLLIPRMKKETLHSRLVKKKRDYTLSLY